MDNLKTSFGKSKVSQSQKTKMVQDVFTDITTKYDLMNNLMSFGMHHLWKKKLVQLMNIQSNDIIVEVGTGTGDIVNLIHKTYSTTSIISVDLNFNQYMRSDLHALMSQKAKHASDVEIVMQKSMAPRTNPVDPNKDWRDVDWKDPFAPKINISGGADSQSQPADVTITLEQDMPPPASPTDSYEIPLHIP